MIRNVRSLRLRSGRVRAGALLVLAVLAIVFLLWQLDWFGSGGGDTDNPEGTVLPVHGEAAPPGPFVIEMRGSGAYVEGQPVERVELLERARTVSAAGRSIHVDVTASALEPDVAGLTNALTEAGIRHVVVTPGR